MATKMKATTKTAYNRLVAIAMYNASNGNYDGTVNVPTNYIHARTIGALMTRGLITVISASSTCITIKVN